MWCGGKVSKTMPTGGPVIWHVCHVTATSTLWFQLHLCCISSPSLLFLPIFTVSYLIKAHTVCQKYLLQEKTWCQTEENCVVMRTDVHANTAWKKCLTLQTDKHTEPDSLSTNIFTCMYRIIRCFCFSVHPATYALITWVCHSHRFDRLIAWSLIAVVWAYWTGLIKDVKVSSVGLSVDYLIN